MTSGTDHPFWPEIEAAFSAFIGGETLGEVIDRLADINERAIVESYREGLSLRKCGLLHGVKHDQAATIIHRRAPGIMRPSRRPKRR